MLIAVTRPVSPSLTRCELTHMPREPIDIARASAQHEAYEGVLRSLAARVVHAPAAPELPDAVFIEDTAVVLDEIAVLTRPGAPSRRRESVAVAGVLSAYRTVLVMCAPATLDGGDVLRVGHTLYVGRSNRTNEIGIQQLRGFVSEFGYQVVPVEFSECLHLKSAVTPLGDGQLLLNPAWVSPASFPDCEVLTIDDREPFAANALSVAGTIVYASQYPRTRDRLTEAGFRVVSTDASELAKAEGAVTCCSLVFEMSGSFA